MTEEEREKPDLLAKQPARRRRIARGSGKDESEVQELVGVFVAMRSQMQTMSKMMAISGGLPPGMDDDEVMGALMGGAGPRQVTPGRVRRKKNFLEELARAQAAEVERAKAEQEAEQAGQEATVEKAQ